MINSKNKLKVLTIGLGYVGLPLCVELKKVKIFSSGFDVNKKLISNLKKSIDTENIINHKERRYLDNIFFSDDIFDFADHNVFIITVPTPIYKNKKPNIYFIMRALDSISKIIKNNDTIILESTVYPGFSEDVVFPFFKKKLGFKLNENYFYGYSPERINPSDKTYNLNNINKIISSDNTKTINLMRKIYGKVVKKAKLYVTESIKVAEAAKVIENTQRDLNISLMNELSIIFNKLNIDTKEVIDAASTKWNFHTYTPGLVGGHCIGIDPYYLAYKSKLLGYRPNVILAGRKINDELPLNIIETIKIKIKKNKTKNTKNILFLGVTFKEDCNDLRNSGSIKLLHMVRISFPKSNLNVIDPLANKSSFKKMTNINLSNLDDIKNTKHNLIIIAVKHSFFKSNFQKIKKYNFSKKPIIIDLKGMLKKSESDFRL